MACGRGSDLSALGGARLPRHPRVMDAEVARAKRSVARAIQVPVEGRGSFLLPRVRPITAGQAVTFDRASYHSRNGDALSVRNVLEVRPRGFVHLCDDHNL